ncbi:polysaccharide export outer membrane protein [Rhodoblastus acidophilus]|uniref:polysaccharide biosynthesis/export family protein n=1 Tax=Rhodoblastus acidophilus TaxID=1074 RepID=UPI002224EBFA|nr:polysaccharide biosynthesis/export family protein [Rhodoblastus acidophilus]MCW2285381.1 polysaccharide export outer membrane protein [Rhodoblastus acidophilus]MCW2334371.1 polysaccharide export outer membrane protein [Rhodoblastus acidophilus]
MSSPLDRSRCLTGLATLGVASLLICAGPDGSAAAPDRPPYRIHPGDVIEVSVAGLPELNMRNRVQPDGAVAFPLIGALTVAGLSTEELRQAVQARFARKVYRRRSPDGRELLVVIQRDEVSAAVADYRPVYVDGDVARPGEIPYRPEMTVRQAVALAGGVDQAAWKSANPVMDMASYKAEYDTLCVEMTKAEAQVARIEGELKGAQRLDMNPSGDAPPRTVDAHMIQIENDIMQARALDYAREQDFLRDSINQLSSRTAVLQSRQRDEEEAAKADNEDLRRMVELLKMGNVANPRVLEARRALLFSQTRALQVTDGLLQLQKQSADLTRQLQHLQDDRKTGLLKELKEARAALAETRIKRDAAQEKLKLTSTARSQLLADDNSRLEIRLARETKGRVSTMNVDRDTQLTPGDVVEIKIKEASPPTSVSVLR